MGFPGNGGGLYCCPGNGETVGEDMNVAALAVPASARPINAANRGFMAKPILLDRD